MMRKDSGTYRSQYRLPLAIADWLKNQAATNFRSVNAELLAILSEAMHKELKDKSLPPQNQDT